jgi:hypothetical protein
MLQLAGDPARVESLGRTARTWAEQLSWAAAADVVEAHLKEMHPALS